MMRGLRRRPRNLASVCLALVVLGLPTIAQAAEPYDLRPNLRMLRLRDWHLVRSGEDHATGARRDRDSGSTREVRVMVSYVY